MTNSLVLTLAGLVITPLIITAPIVAQTPPVPQSDRNGDYFSNEGPVLGTKPSGSRNMLGALWQVQSAKLNCRSGIGLEHKVVRQFKQGERLQADVGRGGSDEVFINGKDKSGKPWMWVRSATGESYNCYVRANRSYIRPVT